MEEVERETDDRGNLLPALTLSWEECFHRVAHAKVSGFMKFEQI